MPTGAASASDLNCQSSLSLVERGERHGLTHGNAEDADADSHCERKKSVHSFLLWFVIQILRSRRIRMHIRFVCETLVSENYTGK
jgi:hypothetical protein